MTLLCPLCMGVNFSSEETLLYNLISSSKRSILCPICSDILNGFDKFTVHLCSHILTCTDSDPINLERNENVNEKLKNLRINSDLKISDSSNAHSYNFLEYFNVIKQPNLKCSVVNQSDITEYLNDTKKNEKTSVNDAIVLTSNENNRCDVYHAAKPFPTDHLNDDRRAKILTKSNSTVDDDKIHFSSKTSEFSSSESKNPATKQSRITRDDLLIIAEEFAPSETGLPIEINISDLFPMDATSSASNDEILFDKSSISLVSSTKQNRGDKSREEFEILRSSTRRQKDPISEVPTRPSDCPVPENDSALSKNINCDACLVTLPSSELLQLHNDLVHCETIKSTTFKVQCGICNENFEMKSTLLMHQQAAHNNVEMMDSPTILLTEDPCNSDFQYYCNICFKFFKKEHYLNQHLKSHENKQWNCDQCGKLFSTKYFLKKHKRLHTGEMPYTCTICDKHFTFQQSYHKHMSYHSDEKPYTCEECGRAFKELATLYNHQRIHTGEKPYSCNICGKHFRQRVSSLVHTRIHTGSKPYRCVICQKSFRYKVSLRNHKCVQPTEINTAIVH